MAGACSRGERRISHNSFQSGVEKTNVVDSDEILISMPFIFGVATWMRAVLFGKAVCLPAHGVRKVLPGVPKSPHRFGVPLFDVSAQVASLQ